MCRTFNFTGCFATQTFYNLTIYCTSIECIEINRNEMDNFTNSGRGEKTLNFYGFRSFSLAILSVRPGQPLAPWRHPSEHYIHCRYTIFVCSIILIDDIVGRIRRGSHFRSKNPSYHARPLQCLSAIRCYLRQCSLCSCNTYICILYYIFEYCVRVFFFFVWYCPKARQPREHYCLPQTASASSR